YQPYARQRRRGDLRSRNDWQARRRGRVPRQPRSPVPWSDFSTSVQPLSSAQVIGQDEPWSFPLLKVGKDTLLDNQEVLISIIRKSQGQRAFRTSVVYRAFGMGEQLKNCAPTVARWRAWICVNALSRSSSWQLTALRGVRAARQANRAMGKWPRPPREPVDRCRPDDGGRRVAAFEQYEHAHEPMEHAHPLRHRRRTGRSCRCKLRQSDDLTVR